MGVPYHTLLVCKDVLFAGRIGDIVSFSSDGLHISTWRHPGTGPKSESEPGNGSAATPEENGVSDEPTVKRRKLDVSEEQDGSDKPDSGEGESTKQPDEPAPKSKRIRGGEPSNPEATPIILGLIASKDWKHVVALTGSDKTIWVFEHDGVGNLKQLSQRVMAKRPCSLVLTEDEKTILSADKFGDVYALPLIPAAESKGDTPIPGGSNLVGPNIFKPEANETTVHTQRNLRALRDQERQRELRKLEVEKGTIDQTTTPSFEHTLLLGHVSMLTSIITATHGGKEYIITGDRDEHIRISRGIPQTYVIEGYCLGHREFVSKLSIPPSRPDLLISAGGDNGLFVWDWKAYKFLSKTNLLGHIKKVLPDATNLAVSGLWSWHQAEGDASGTWVAVICERVPVLFLFKLTASATLEHVQAIRLPGHPLGFARLGSESSPRLLVSTDSSSLQGLTESASLRVVTFDSQNGWTLSGSPFSEQEGAGYGEASTGPVSEDVHKSLYSMESLRKTDFDEVRKPQDAAA